jgi:hypothetical protein
MNSFYSRFSVAAAWLVLALFSTLQPTHASDRPALPATCYLFAYFVGTGDNGLHLAWSRDGLKWSVLKGGKSFLASTVGNKKMRDPFLMLGPDKIFHLVWTSSDHLQIGYASSPDLITWSDQAEPAVMASEPDAINCWAPSINYDKTARDYQLTWSSTIPGRFPKTVNQTEGNFNHRLYATTTIDFQTFAPARLLYDPGFPTIDSVILPAGKKFYLIFKNETLRPTLQKNLWMASSDSLSGPYGHLTGAIKTNPPSFIEGPSAIKIRDNYIVYYDCYFQNRYGAIRSGHLRNWQDITPQLVMPPGMRHGSVLAVPSSVIANILDLK